jgi:diguanylate cyclase (GGDEF)-like protein
LAFRDLQQPIPWWIFGLWMACIAVPAVGTMGPFEFPEGSDALLWFVCLVPAFMLSYYRGWAGTQHAYLSTVVAMAAVYGAMAAFGLGAPDRDVIFGVVLAFSCLVIGTGRLSERLHETRLQAERRALTDTLTGLPNRRALDMMLPRIFATGQRGTPVAVVMFDLDHFKSFNDRFGHAAGDRALRLVGRLLRQHAREEDLCTRYGGEEFFCVLFDCTASGAMTFTERVRRDLVQSELTFGAITVSAGVAIYSARTRGADDLVRLADEALYVAKRQRRNCTMIAPADPPTFTSERTAG